MADVTSRGPAIVVGASGLLGRAVCRRLASDGWRVTGLCRTPPTGEPPGPDNFPGMDWVAGDRRDPDVVARLLAQGPTLWIDLALDDAAAARDLVVAARDGPTRFVASGTIGEEGVHAFAGDVVPEGRDPDPDDDPHTLGCVAAWRVLDAARASGGPAWAWAVLPRLWGPGDRSGRDAAWVWAILEDRPVLLRGDGGARLPDGSSDAAAAAVIAGATVEALAGRRYHACGPGCVTPLELVRAAARALGRRARIALVDPRAWAAVEARFGTRVEPALPDRELRLERRALDAAGIGADRRPEEGMAASARFLAARSCVPAARFVPDPDVALALAREGRIVEVD